jgi:hypothetical protein
MATIGSTIRLEQFAFAPSRHQVDIEGSRGGARSRKDTRPLDSTTAGTAFTGFQRIDIAVHPASGRQQEFWHVAH